MDNIRKPGSQLLAEALAQPGAMRPADLCRALNINTGTLSKWKTGKRHCDLYFALKLKEILGIPAEAWLPQNESDVPKKKSA